MNHQIPIQLKFKKCQKHFLAGEILSLVLISRNLIHIILNKLVRAFNDLNTAASLFLFVAENCNPSFVVRLHCSGRGQLFNREFVSETVNHHSRMDLIGYCFAHQRNSNFQKNNQLVLDWRERLTC